MRMTNRPVFIIALRAERGVDAIRALRAALKILGRRFGLRAISVKQFETKRSKDHD
jgi:hypothetical protein